MPKLYKAEKPRETLCKDYHMQFNQMGMPAKLEPNLFLIADTDKLQQQVNVLQNKVARMERAYKKGAWQRCK